MLYKIRIYFDNGKYKTFNKINDNEYKAITSLTFSRNMITLGKFTLNTNKIIFIKVLKKFTVF